MIFDRRLYRKRRDRIAAHFAEVDFLKHAAAELLADRLADITHCFPLALELGCHNGMLSDIVGTAGSIEQWVQTDLSARFASQSKGLRVVADEEWLPFADHTFDLVVSAMSLHHVNDLAGCFIQIRRILKPDGLFLCVMPGSQTLHELRHSLASTQELLSGGISPMVSPFMEVRDAGALLQRAGFALPVVDTSLLHLRYGSPAALIRELKQMGESNILLDRKSTAPRGLLQAASVLYHQQFPDPDAPDHIRATIELITLTGWSPHASQQQPAKRGSGQMHLGDALH